VTYACVFVWSTMRAIPRRNWYGFWYALRISLHFGGGATGDVSSSINTGRESGHLGVVAMGHVWTYSAAPPASPRVAAGGAASQSYSMPLPDNAGHR
jgi:hypothetical protein